jgi:hypothetical protein
VQMAEMMICMPWSVAGTGRLGKGLAVRLR